MIGCAQKDFPPEKAQAIINAQPYQLDAEQVMMTGGEVDCGEREDLWDPKHMVAEREVSSLTEKGRALHFDDDIVVSEPGLRNPYAQVRGEFMLQMPEVMSIRDPEPDVKLVEGKIVAFINHPCFVDPVVIKGVRKGNFDERTLPVARFELNDKGWRFVRLEH